METAAVMPTAKTKITNPFPGLRPFSPDESKIFFGRDGLSDVLIDKLQDTRFVAVVGTSGSGKSSLVRAGLVPTLRCGFTEAGSGWHVAMFRPINNPIRNLAKALAQCGVLSPDSDKTGISVENIEENLRRSSFGLVELMRAARLSKYENLLIIADQFEELYRFEPSEEVENPKEEASAFVRLLLEATSQEDLPIHVILTMRSDYLGDSAQFWGLPEAINRGQFLIPRMDDDEKREAIEGPVRVFNAKISPSLVNRLLNDVGDDPRQLPILQHALMRTWDYWKAHHRDSEAIGIEHYDNIKVGGMKKALSIHADEAYNHLNSEQQELAQRIFKRLTEKGVGKREGRLPATVAELTEISQADEADVITVINAFRQEGRSFLMPPPAKPPADPAEPAEDAKPVTSQTLIDISHESLISGWVRLSDWVEEEADSAKTYEQLVYDAERYPRKTGLLTNPELESILKWRALQNPNEAWARRYRSEWGKALDADPNLPRSDWAKPKDSEYAIATTYLDLSKKEHDRLEAQRERKRWRAFISVSATAILLFVLFVTASILARRADLERQRANESELKAFLARDAADEARLKEYRAKEEAYRAQSETEWERQKAETNLQYAQAAAAEAKRQQALAVASSNREREMAILGEGYKVAMSYPSLHGDINKALKGLEQVKGVYERQYERRPGSRADLAATEFLIGNLILEADDADDAAIRHYKSALEISVKDPKALEPSTFVKMGDRIRESFLDDEETIPFYKRALELMYSPKDNKSIFDTWLNLGNAYTITNFDEALAAYIEARKIAEASGDFTGKGDALRETGDSYLRRAQFGQALGAYMQALDAYRRVTTSSPTFQALLGEARTLEAAGRVSQRQDDNILALSRYREARQSFQKALGRARTDKERADITRATEYLDYRIELLVPSITEILSQTIRTEGIEAAVKQYRDLKRNAPREYDFDEIGVNSFGYRLLRDNKISEAIEIFKLNVESYPKSFNTYDSLADGYVKAGDKTLAIANYQKALELNPQSTTTRAKLKELQPN